MKDGRRVRRVPMQLQPEVTPATKYFRFHIEEVDEYFVSNHVEPRAAYNHYLKATKTYKAKADVTVERICERDQCPSLTYDLNRDIDREPPYLQLTTATAAGGGGGGGGGAGGAGGAGGGLKYLYRIVEIDRLFETITRDIFDSYRIWRDSSLTYACDCGDSDCR